MSGIGLKVFELRFYTVEANRDADIKNRVRNDLSWLFPRHGIRPIAGWNAISAPSLPLFVYLTPFRDMIERDRNWTGFYTDPDWQEVRNRTNAGSELVQDYQIWFLREIAPWTDPGPAGGFDEILFLRTLVGKSGAAGNALLASELPALERTGARLIGAFDVISGGTLPMSIAFVRWPDIATRTASVAALGQDASLVTARAAQTEEFGTTLVGRSGSYLLDPLVVDWK